MLKKQPQKYAYLEWSTVLWTDTSLSILLWLTSDLFPLEMVIPHMKHISRSIVTSCVTEGRGVKLSNIVFLVLGLLSFPSDHVTTFCSIVTGCVTERIQAHNNDVLLDIVSHSLT